MITNSLLISEISPAIVLIQGKHIPSVKVFQYIAYADTHY
jgi:hypothetical protein